ncbi:hypothetical protein [Agrobacterium pusense]|uniref:hypothetical protein n=1 Tax=Agrobacterium pusense TaxID=648995 RepID=UPI000512BAA7|nr:hypothetical protein [Agrobacterium pusense]ANV24596.1 hypothetical protein BA939_12005 [Rhizobium sp. S41]KGE82915.1 hypothetical protein LW14_10535 [Rhizobium sp. H41]QWW74279.1 hypothetical protein KP800_01875 [Agrobacterium pusense]
MIAFMWKIVRGEVTSDETEAWSKETVARLDAEAKAAFGGVQARQSDVVALEEKLGAIRQQVKELGDHFSAMTSAVCLAGKQGDEEK